MRSRTLADVTRHSYAHAAMRIDLYIHNGTDSKLDEILVLLRSVHKEQETMSKELDDLTAQVKANTDLEASAVSLIEGIAAQLAAAATDPVKVSALAGQLQASAAALSAAIFANTTPSPSPQP